VSEKKSGISKWTPLITGACSRRERLPGSRGTWRKKLTKPTEGEINRRGEPRFVQRYGKKGPESEEKKTTKEEVGPMGKAFAW